jgi:hypothetical protein
MAPQSITKRKGGICTLVNHRLFSFFLQCHFQDETPVHGRTRSPISNGYVRSSVRGRSPGTGEIVDRSPSNPRGRAPLLKNGSLPTPSKVLPVGAISNSAATPARAQPQPTPKRKDPPTTPAPVEQTPKRVAPTPSASASASASAAETLVV